ncbi:MAG: DUF362 domain-containing protein [Myxococcales bacterium]|nr:DUF362 domain-containing protein [Myxococcales bacterium]
MRGLVALVVIAACKGSGDPAPPAPAQPPAARPPVTADTVTAASPGQGSAAPGTTVVATGETVDGAALMAVHRARLASDRSAVTALVGGTPLELGQRLCEQVVPSRPPATPVLIKPNMGGFNWFKNPKTHAGDDGVKGRTTDPEFVRGIVRCLKARGHTQITIADGFTGKAKDWDRLVRISGYAAMAKAEGVTLVALDDDGVFDVQPGTPGKALAVSGIEQTSVPTLLVPKLVADHLHGGLFLSAPKLKTHRFSVFSVAIKGMQGVVMYADRAPAFHQKWRSHKELDRALKAIKAGDANGRALYVKSLEVFAERMVDVLELETPDAVLVEGAPAMDGDGFDELFPRAESIALGGTNPVLVDRAAAAYLGLWDNAQLAAQLGGHRTSPLLEVAAKRYGLDLATLEVIGDGASRVTRPQPAHLHGMAGFGIGCPGTTPEGACTAGHTDAATKDLRAARVGEPPAIDGVIEEAWATAAPLSFATDWAGRATTTVTRVRALWSPTALYLLFELDGAGLDTDQARPLDRERIDLYEEDAVEVFLAPDPAQRRRYAEIELGPFGHWFDLMIDRTGKKVVSDASWSAGLTIGTARDAAKRTAVIEVAITAPEVVTALAPDARLPLGLYRMEARTQYLAAFPTRTPRPNFHVPDAFGTLVLDP